MAIWNVRDICAELLERDLLVKFPIKDIGKCHVLQRFLHNELIWILSPNLGKQMVFSHDSTDLLVIHGDVISE